MFDLVTLAVPFFLLLMILEAIYAFRINPSLYSWKDGLASISMGIGNFLVTLAFGGILFALFTWVHTYALFDMGISWKTWMLVFILEDMTFYFFHRISHKIRFLWAIHVNHHSSQHFNLSTALRQPWLEVFCILTFWLWLPFLGFEPYMVLTAQSVSLIYQFWIHTQLIGKLGPLEWIFNTPSHHRIHHAVNDRYIDKNFGGVLIVWDRVFGTFVEEKEKPVYGITKNIETYNPIKIAFHEWVTIGKDLKMASTWKEKARAML